MTQKKTSKKKIVLTISELRKRFFEDHHLENVFAIFLMVEKNLATYCSDNYGASKKGFLDQENGLINIFKVHLQKNPCLEGPAIERALTEYTEIMKHIALPHASYSEKLSEFECRANKMYHVLLQSKYRDVIELECLKTIYQDRWEIHKQVNEETSEAEFLKAWAIPEAEKRVKQEFEAWTTRQRIEFIRYKDWLKTLETETRKSTANRKERKVEVTFGENSKKQLESFFLSKAAFITGTRVIRKVILASDGKIRKPKYACLYTVRYIFKKGTFG
jgi:DNA primase